MRWSNMMVKISVVFTMLLVAAAMSHAASRGRGYFVQYCSSCHGLDARGNGPKAHTLHTQPSDLTQIARRRGGYFPEQQVIAYIDGRSSIRGYRGRDMPVWGRQFADMAGRGNRQAYAKRMISDLAHYLKTIQLADNAH